MTTVLFLRHGPTKENLEQRMQGHQPGTLLIRETEHYLAAIIPLLRHHTPTVLLSSDLSRAVATRRLLRQFLHYDPVFEDAWQLLRERSHGSCEGLLWSQAPDSIQAQKAARKGYDFKPWGGEDNTDVQKRVITTLEQLTHHFPNDTVICITHAGWMQQFSWIAQRYDLDDTVLSRTAILESEVAAPCAISSLQVLTINAKLPVDES